MLQSNNFKKAALSGALLLATSGLFAQISFEYNTNNPDNTQVEEIFDTNVLPSGAIYDLEVEGTYSIWTSSYWSSPCGAYESFPMFSSYPVTSDSGKVGFDPEYIFGLAKTSQCTGRTMPEQTSRIEYSVDNGATWFHPTTATAYNSNHKYTYQITGQGYPLGIRHISGYNSDDYGVLKLTLTQNVLCSTSLDFNTYNTDDALVEVIAGTDNLSVGITYTMLVDGTYSIWAPTYWTGPCGTPESAPKYSSAPATSTTGQVGFDFEYEYAYPTTAICSGASFPTSSTRIEVSLDGGTTWSHPTTTDSYTTNHVYSYSVVGQGYPLLVRHTSALNSDDYGTLKFNLYACGVPRLKSKIEQTSKQDYSFTLFPNPTNNQLNIQSNIESLQDIKLFNLMGQEFNIEATNTDASNIKLNVSELPVGVYFVNLYVNGEIHTQKFIKE